VGLHLLHDGPRLREVASLSTIPPSPGWHFCTGPLCDAQDRGGGENGVLQMGKTTRATITETAFARKLPTLYESITRIIDLYSPDLYTALRVWVPVPRHVEHQPAILIKFSNAQGPCMFRVNPEGLEALIQTLQSIYLNPTLTQAWQQAVNRNSTYKALDKQLQEQSLIPREAPTEGA